MKKQRFFGIRHTPGCAVELLSTTSHTSGFLPTARLIPILLTIALFTMTTARGDTEFFACSESGTGNTYLKVCVSNTGNVTLFKSPWGMEHIRVIDGPGNELWADSSAIEGFMVCRWDPNGWSPGIGDWVGYYDFGAFFPPDPDYPWRFWDYGWNASYNISQPNGPNKFPLIVSRRSYDDRFELKQEFTVDAAERELAITMTLSNKSGLQQDVRLARIASLNIDNTSEDEMAFIGARSVTQFDSGAPYGGNRDAVSLSANTANYSAHFTSTNTFYGEVVRDLCGGGNIGYANGHTFSGMSYQFGNLAAGASRKVKFAYRAF